MPGIRIAGVDMHIGSQIVDLAPFEDAFAILAELVGELRADGHAIHHVDLGGGLGIPYRTDNEPPPEPLRYGEIVRRHIAPLGCKVIIEPGRLIVGNAGVLLAKVLYVKEGEAKTFVIIDAGMNDLIRPTLYEAFHDIRPVKEPAPGGPRWWPTWSARCARPATSRPRTATCRSSKAGDLIAILTAGAYGAVQASTYNTRPLVPEVLVKGDEWALVRPRVGVEVLITLDRLPPWL